MPNIPHSNWILKKEFFEAKLVNDFESLYRDWHKKNGTTDCADLDRFITYLNENPTIELYQFPNPTGVILPYDYFEKDDDNHVIPRFLFEPLT